MPPIHDVLVEAQRDVRTSLRDRDVYPRVPRGLCRNDGHALDAADRVGALAVVVIDQPKRIVGGRQQRPRTLEPNEPALNGVVLTADSVYGQFKGRVLVDVLPDIFELVTIHGRGP